MRLRILIPPNLESSAQRDAIPIKLEVAQNDGAIARPESIPPEKFAELDDNERAAAFSLLQWSNGSLTSFLQLDRAQLRQLTEFLLAAPVFFWVNRSQEPIAWNGHELVDVSRHLSAEDTDSQTRSESDPPRTSKPKERARFEGAPMTVDGSQHYLSIGLPSREHPRYAEIRELLDFHRFKLEPSNRKWWLRDRHQTLNFLGGHWDDLENRYGATFSENFLQRMDTVKDVRLSAQVQEDGNAYSLHLTLSAGNADPRQISQSLNSGRNYIESGERVYLLKKKRVEELHSLQKTLQGSPDAPLLHQGVYRVALSSAPQIESKLVELNPNFKPPATWRRRSAALRDLDQLKQPALTPALDATLRPYQKIGVAWLRHLFDHQLGGILADEMGLGKTIQALALVSSLNQSTTAPEPSLVVCPASLVENWRREAALHAPDLNVFVNHGQNRFRDAGDLENVQLVVTSYSTLARDQARFATLNFQCIIADEAQHIKNRRAQVTKALLSLEAPGRFLLTGTPIENRIQDLMSLLDFILPGGWKDIPKDARGEERQWHERRILELAAPYILRRSKEEVAPELPEKLEHVLYVEMTPEQRTLYDATKQDAETELQTLADSGASDGAMRMKTLTQLLRLRQACCDPRIVAPAAAPESSAKRASFLELFQESIDGGHRILVFSQFVSILSFLKEELDALDAPYCYLDGSTRKRMEQVDRFQTDPSIPVFLISLKAGGTGLNLTGADTVIHFDPWWNPAAESQATDRAHRIGQTKVVTSYKLIVSNSVEENVLQLQASKRKLLKDVFDASEIAQSKMGLDDLRSLLS